MADYIRTFDFEGFERLNISDDLKRKLRNAMVMEIWKVNKAYEEIQLVRYVPEKISSLDFIEHKKITDEYALMTYDHDENGQFRGTLKEGIVFGGVKINEKPTVTVRLVEVEF